MSYSYTHLVTSDEDDNFFSCREQQNLRQNDHRVLDRILHGQDDGEYWTRLSNIGQTDRRKLEQKMAEYWTKKTMMQCSR
jgi:hypothetical protein